LSAATASCRETGRNSIQSPGASWPQAADRL
jgi:hypothetical protein